MFSQDRLELLSADQLFIGRSNIYSITIRLLLPLIAVIPFADSYFVEKKNNLLPVLISRSSRRQYYFSKLFVVFISSVIVIAVPLLINMMLNSIAFPVSSLRDSTGWSSDETWYRDAFLEDRILFPNLFILHPYLYNFVFTAMLSLFSGLVGVFSYAASYFVKKNRVFVIALFFIINSVLELLSFVTEDFGVVIAPFKYLFAWDVTLGKSMMTFAMIVLVTLSAIVIMTGRSIKKLEDVL
jgi:hypothetical protein